MKVALILDSELTPPWSDGIKVFARGLFSSIINIDQVELTTITNLSDITKSYEYDYAHIVYYPPGPMTIIKPLRELKNTIVFKHFITPAMTFTTAINTKIFYTTVGVLDGKRLVKCFSSEFVAHSYFMQSDFIVPPSIDTANFINRPKNWDRLFSMLQDRGTRIWVNNIDKSNAGLILYSGPLSADRFPYTYVLNAVKHAKCQILIVGRFWQELNQEMLSYVNDILNYATRIGIENKVSIISRTLDEEEKNTLINCADAIIQPFDSTLKNIAVDPPVFLLESMACGKPVIASKFHSLTSVIRDGYNGYTVDWHDPVQFDEALSDCLNNNNKIGNNARDTILHKFSIDAVTEKLRGMYDAFS
jgi:glycosyltransferase involved in cell wall biosynthesis